MKKYIYFGLFILALFGVLTIQHRMINSLKAERDTYKQNTNTLLSDIDSYRAMDSLQVVSITELSLTIDEYRKHRQQDLKLIENLKVDRKRLQQITTAQTETVYELHAPVRDSVTRNDSIRVDTLRCVSINEKWFDLNGCIDTHSTFTGTFESRDSLIYVEHILPKRFWFIRWGVKERRQEIVSRNPNTRIVGAEFVTIRK